MYFSELKGSRLRGVQVFNPWESKKPLFFLNTAGFWIPFVRLFIHMQKCGFIESIHDYNILGANTVADLIKRIKDY